MTRASTLEGLEGFWKMKQFESLVNINKQVLRLLTCLFDRCNCKFLNFNGPTVQMSTTRLGATQSGAIDLV